MSVADQISFWSMLTVAIVALWLILWGGSR